MEPRAVQVPYPVSTPGPTVYVKVPLTPSGLFHIAKASADHHGVITLELTLPDAGTFATSAHTTRNGKTTTYGTPRSGKAKGLSTATVTIKPTRAAASSLRKLQKLRVALSITFTPTGGTKHTEQTTVTITETR